MLLAQSALEIITTRLASADVIAQSLMRPFTWVFQKIVKFRYFYTKIPVSNPVFQLFAMIINFPHQTNSRGSNYLHIKILSKRGLC